MPCVVDGASAERSVTGIGIIGIDGIGADIEKMRRRHGGEGLQRRLRHAQVGEELRARFGRRDRRDEDNGIGGRELRLEAIGAIGLEQIHVLTRQAANGNVLPGELCRDR